MAAYKLSDRKSVYGRRIFPALRLIYGWPLSLPSL